MYNVYSWYYRHCSLYFKLYLPGHSKQTRRGNIDHSVSRILWSTGQARLRSDISSSYRELCKQYREIYVSKTHTHIHLPNFLQISFQGRYTNRLNHVIASLDIYWQYLTSRWQIAVSIMNIPILNVVLWFSICFVITIHQDNLKLVAVNRYVISWLKIIVSKRMCIMHLLNWTTVHIRTCNKDAGWNVH